MQIRADRREKIEYNWVNGFYYFTFGSYYNPLLMGFNQIQAVNVFELQQTEQFGRNDLDFEWEQVVIVLKGSLRVNTSIKDQITLHENSVIKFFKPNKDEEYWHQIQNISDKQPATFIQIFSQRNTNEENQNFQITKDILQSKFGEKIVLFNDKEKIQYHYIQLEQDKQYEQILEKGKSLFILNIDGKFDINKQYDLNKDDAIGLSQEDVENIKITANKQCKILLIDLINN